MALRMSPRRMRRPPPQLPRSAAQRPRPRGPPRIAAPEVLVEVVMDVTAHVVVIVRVFVIV